MHSFTEVRIGVVCAEGVNKCMWRQQLVVGEEVEAEWEEGRKGRRRGSGGGGRAVLRVDSRLREKGGNERIMIAVMNSAQRQMIYSAREIGSPSVASQIAEDAFSEKFD